ncbi:hypothetical protein [Streptomyces olivochromogenes]|nr:hypothetical protein [Streptomyces olivochromogenes]
MLGTDYHRKFNFSPACVNCDFGMLSPVAIQFGRLVFIFRETSPI